MTAGTLSRPCASLIADEHDLLAARVGARRPRAGRSGTWRGRRARLEMVWIAVFEVLLEAAGQDEVALAVAPGAAALWTVCWPRRLRSAALLVRSLSSKLLLHLRWRAGRSRAGR